MCRCPNNTLNPNPTNQSRALKYKCSKQCHEYKVSWIFAKATAKNVPTQYSQRVLLQAYFQNWINTAVASEQYQNSIRTVATHISVSGLYEYGNLYRACKIFVALLKTDIFEHKVKWQWNNTWMQWPLDTSKCWLINSKFWLSLPLAIGQKGWLVLGDSDHKWQCLPSSNQTTYTILTLDFFELPPFMLHYKLTYPSTNQDDTTECMICIGTTPNLLLYG